MCLLGSAYAVDGAVDGLQLASARGRLLGGHGQIVENVGWVDNDYIGIDQGPILAMIENHRSDLVWSTMRRHPVVRLGLQRAGFTGGWLA